jgi:protein-L-isoaspartate(D-aspartate) O-methyltransferase
MRRLGCVMLIVWLSACSVPVTPSQPATPAATGVDEFAGRRERMVMDQIEGREIRDPAVLRAMRRVARHDFVPAEYIDQAYDDHPLPIGFGQTISQPYIVALMSEALQLKPGDRVLEIGTGSGYQAAVLAEMGMKVYTIEIIRELADQAAARLQALGYTDVHVRAADGYEGWPEETPFDAIVVTAAPDHIPQPLIDQLKPGGQLVIPVGPIGAVQTLWQITLDEAREVTAYNLGAVRFVPLTRSEQTP